MRTSEVIIRVQLEHAARVMPKVVAPNARPTRAESMGVVVACALLAVVALAWGMQ